MHARVRRIVVYSYLFGGIIASAGAILDPRGPMEILRSGALSSFAAAIGLLRVPSLYRSSPPAQPASSAVLSRSLAWILAAILGSLSYILLLGRGIPFRF
jgi:hypothetical protein